MATELLRLRCRGHQDIRATHGKTLEVTADPDITGRATCVVGVAAKIVGPVGGPVGAVAGPVEVTLSVAGLSVSVRALANSRWRPGASFVIRRSPHRLPNTLATNADLSSADFPRPLVDALADPAAEIDVVVTRAPTPDRYSVLYRASYPDDRLVAECAAADSISATDSAARALVTGLGYSLSTRVGRTLQVSTVESFAEAADEVLGLPPELTVAAVLEPAPVVVVPGLPRREVMKVAATTQHAHVVFTCPADELPRWLADATRLAGTTHAAVLPFDERPMSGAVSDIEAIPGSGTVWCALARTNSFTEADVDPRALFTSLKAEGVSSTSLVRALSGQPGWSRKQAYDFVLGVE
ncbi:DUF371 domain-containing protein [Actinokineospora inagensis]|uniref:DUF371 domain-containing protein n=1 Tax=Actinokineospora inagensis TaxID=103730 RepID=UPI0004285955|nr:DUF371 domain-containing protein [Actinokineospora inagensis]